VHVILVVAAAGWGIASGYVVARIPWRGWIGADEPARPRRERPEPVASLGAAVCVAIAQPTGARPELAVWLLLVPVGLLLARIDLAVHRLPDAVTLPAGVGTAVLLGGAALLPGHRGTWAGALLGAAALAAAYCALMLINPSGIGFGDVKLAPTLGLVLGWYGWSAVIAGFCLTFVLGALAVVVLLLARRATRKTALAFGPFMLLGTLGGLLLALR
jgi:leader peptidase (prepilin peptidase) / N-methyltransferase